MPPNNIITRSMITSVATLAIVFAGCETNDYQPLRVKKQLRELREEVEQLKQEVRELKGEAGNSDQTSAVNSNSAAPAIAALNIKPPAPVKRDLGSSQLAPNLNSASQAISSRQVASKEQEQTVRAQLESANAYFSTDNQGFTIEADLNEFRDINAALEKIKSFGKLKKILVAGRRTDEKSFEQIAAIDSLEHLEAIHSSPSPAAMGKLADLPKLQFLQLQKASISEDGVKAISASTSLKQFRCSQTRVGDPELLHLAKIKTLEAVDLSDCNRVTTVGVEALSNLPKLKFLKVWGKSINDQTLNVIGGIKSLRVLGLNDTAISDKGITALAGLNLSEAHLFRTAVGDDAVKVLSGMSNLTSLNLRDTKISDAALKYLVGAPKLKKLDLSECNAPGVTDAGCVSIAKMKNLQQLNLWTTQVTNAGVKELAKLPKLTWLNLDNTPIGDEAVESISGMPLTWLHLGKTGITDNAAASLEKIKTLKFVSLSQTKISKDAFYEIDDALSPRGCYVKAP